VDVELKFEPTTLKVKPVPPWSLLFGDIASMVGSEFGGGGGGAELLAPQAMSIAKHTKARRSATILM